MKKWEFVNDPFRDTFRELFITFINLKNELRDCLELKSSYNERLNNNYYDDETVLSFKEQLTLINIIDYYIRSDRIPLYSDVDLNVLKEKVDSLICSDIIEYNKLLKRIRNININLDSLFHSVTFFRLEEKKFSSRCRTHHYFVRLPNELRCVCCGATTKDCELTSEELDFLEKCADKQEQLIKNATKDDLPLLEAILIPQLDYNFNMLYDSIYDKYGEKKIENEDKLSYLDLTLQRDEEIHDLNRWIKWAHALDAGTFNTSFKPCPKYLPDDIGEKLLLNIEKDLEKINNSNSRFKDLMVEFCNMTRYEILILLGNNIIDLYNQAKDEDSQYALAKAYYNLSCEEYRKHSGYFPEDDKNRDAIFYECLTASPAINKKVLKMKKRCKKVD